MKFNYNQLDKFLDVHPELANRKFQYLILARMFNVDEETAKNICSTQRLIRKKLKPIESHEQQRMALEELGYPVTSIHSLSSQKNYGL
jgi:hypothetical protein